MEISDFKDVSYSSYYAKCKKWSPKKWAWEFLRRNEEFQKDCDACDTEEKENEIAEKYGIKKYKNYSEQHKVDGVYTSFIVGRPMFYPYKKENEKDGIDKKRIFLREGQLLIKCDLSKSIDYQWVVKTIVDKINKRIKRDFNKIKSKQHPIFDMENAVKHLMILDELKKERDKDEKDKMTNYEIYLKLYPETSNTEKEYIKNKFDNLKKAAVKVTKESYLYYAMLTRSDLK